MSGLRCWPGCLAVIIRSEAGNEGRIVHCIRLALSEEIDRPRFHPHVGPVWLVDRVLPMSNGLRSRLVGDFQLTPITPPPGTDCTTHDADKPQPVEA